MPVGVGEAGAGLPQGTGGRGEVGDGGPGPVGSKQWAQQRLWRRGNVELVTEARNKYLLNIKFNKFFFLIT